MRAFTFIFLFFVAISANVSAQNFTMPDLENDDSWQYYGFDFISPESTPTCEAPTNIMMVQSWTKDVDGQQMRVALRVSAVLGENNEGGLNIAPLFLAWEDASTNYRNALFSSNGWQVGDEMDIPEKAKMESICNDDLSFYGVSITITAGGKPLKKVYKFEL